MAGVQATRTVSASYTAAQSNAVLVAVPASGSRIVVHWAVFSNGDTAGELKLLDGAKVSAAITASGVSSRAITALSKASPTVITCGANVATGTIVTITGSDSVPNANGVYTATNVDATKFSVPFNVATTAGTTGLVTWGSYITVGAYVPTGTRITISGESTATPALNGTYTVTNVDATRFSIPVIVTSAGTDGTADTASGYGNTLAAALLAINTPMYFDGSRAPLVLSAATPLCFTSVTAATHRVNLGYSIES
jgi:hypothetical protein